MKRILYALSMLFLCTTQIFANDYLQCRLKVAQRRLERRQAIAAVKKDQAQQAIKSAQKTHESCVQEQNNPQGLFRNLYTHEDRKKFVADAAYEIAKAELAAEELKKETEQHITESEKYVVKALKALEHENSMHNDPEYAADYNARSKARVEQIVTSAVKSSAIVVGGALLVYAAWKSRTWQGWQHLKNGEFKKFGNSIQEKIVDAGVALGIIKAQKSAPIIKANADKKSK